MSAESIPDYWGDAQAMRLTAEMELDVAEGRKLRFKVGAGRRRRLCLARLEKKGGRAPLDEAGETGGSDGFS